MNIVAIQSTFSGYMEKPCSLFSGYDLDSRILSVQLSTPFMAKRREGCVVITNQTNLDRDILFKEEHFLQAIQSYFDMRNGVAEDGQSQRLLLSTTLPKADPSVSLEKGEMDQTKQKYRINGSLSCLQMAVLATCWYVHTRCGVINTALNQAKKLNTIWQASRGEIHTF